jgi:hypothetical protein
MPFTEYLVRQYSNGNSCNYMPFTLSTK